MDIFEWLLLVLMLEFLNIFYCICWLKFSNLYTKQAVSQTILYKKGIQKNFSKFTDKNKKQSSTGILSKDVLKKFAKSGVYF